MVFGELASVDSSLIIVLSVVIVAYACRSLFGKKENQGQEQE